MTGEIYISDTEANFKPHKSLLDNPLCFETENVKGCVFYLACDGELGGDTFRIKADHCLTVSLLTDSESHGSEAREKVEEFFENLDSLVNTLSSHRFDELNIVNELVNLEKNIERKLTMILSFLRILRNNQVCYLSGTGNNIVIYNKKEVYTIPEEHNYGRSGFYPGVSSDILTQHFLKYLHNLSISPGDRLLVYTDGVIEYKKELLGDENHEKKRMREIEQTLAKSIQLSDVIKKINSSAAKDITKSTDLKNDSIILPYDDYTIIGVEIK